MDLSQLKTLIQVAQLGSLAKAADRLRIAQPALSRQIRLLEEELKTQLFTRHGRGMLLTNVGRTVLEHANAIIREVEMLRSDVDTDRSQLEGNVVLGMPPTVGEIVTVPLTQMLQKEYPRVRLRYTAGFGGHLLEWLQRGDVDLAVLYDPKPLKSVRIRPLLNEALYVVGSRDKNFAMNRPVNFAELAKQPFILPSLRHSLRVLVENAAHEVHVPLDVRFEVEALVTIKDLVLSGAGISFLPLSSIHGDISSGRMSAAPVVNPDLCRNLIVACSTDRVLSRAGRICEDMLVDFVHGLQGSGSWISTRPVNVETASVV